MAEKVTKGIPTKITILSEGRIRVTLECDEGASEQFLTAANSSALLIDRLAIVMTAAIAHRRPVVMGYRDELDGRPPTWVEMS